MRMRVSLCMIARNEALSLPRCLTSVAGLVDEMIVVDTGSVDDTRAVAERLGAAVHDFTWVDDFAAARNESLRHATGEWILWLDGDEYLDADNRAQLRALLDALKDEDAAYLMHQRSSVVSSDEQCVVFPQCRLFRNHPAIRWHYRVHEQIQPAVERSGGTVHRTGIHIEHAGYEDAALYRRKLERNLRLLLLEDRERPDDPFTLMNLGWAYKDLGQTAAAVAYCQRSLARSKPGRSVAPKVHTVLVRGHRALGRREQALEACRAGRAIYPDDVELSFLEAVLLSEAGDLPAAEALLLRLLDDRPGDHYAIAAQPGMRGYMARHNLARIYRAQRRDAEAEIQWLSALAQRPDNVQSGFELGRMYVEQGRTDEAEPIAGQLATLGPVGELAATMLRAQSHLRRGDVALARRLLETAVATGPPALEPRMMLSRLLVEHGGEREAVEGALRGVLALDPNQAWARNQLAGLGDKEGRAPIQVSPHLNSRNEAEPRAVARRHSSQRETGAVPIYNSDSYMNIHQLAYRSAKEVVPRVLELLKPKSVVDVGCGIGSWLAVFREHGIADVLGVDGANVDLDLLQIPREQFLAADLAQPLQVGRQFELAMALEVAEHLGEDCAATFIASLVKLAPVVLFSAAVPHQGGHHHVNEQWPGYWVNLFERHGYLVLDCLRDKVWMNDRVEWWYCQNMLLFCSPQALVQSARLQRELAFTQTARLPLVHPKMFLQAVGVIQDLRRQVANLREQKSPPESR